MTATSPGPLGLSPRDLDLHLNARASATALGVHLAALHGDATSGLDMASLMDRHRAAHGPASPASTELDDALSARLRKVTDDAHGQGLRTAGYNAALDDVSILLAEQVERLEGLGSPRAVKGIRWALGAIKGMR